MTPSYASGLAALKHRRHLPAYGAVDALRENEFSEAELLAAVLEGPYASLVDRALLSEQDLLKVELAARQNKIDAASILMQQYAIPQAKLREQNDHVARLYPSSDTVTGLYQEPPLPMALRRPDLGLAC